MSGGGTLGAYEIGAVYGMYFNSEDKTKFEYDVITGVSAGSINTGGMGLFEVGDEENMLITLSKKWTELTTSQVFENWFPLGIVTGVLHKTGVLNDAPLAKFVNDFFDEYGGELKRKLVVSHVNVNTGSYVNVNETDPDFTKGIIASSSIPFVFPNIPYSNYVAMDGGTVWNTNLVSAVQRCREIVDDDHNIIIDIVECSAVEKNWNDQGSSLSNFLKYREMRSYHDGMSDISAI